MMKTRASSQATTILQYPGFYTLPKMIKRMLLHSESLFFQQARANSVRWQVRRRIRPGVRLRALPLDASAEDVVVQE